MSALSRLDWSAVLTGSPRAWLVSGLFTTLELTVLASLVATLVGVLVTALRLAPWRVLAWLGAGFVALFRNTPLAVQLLFWYFGGFRLLSEGVRDWLNDRHVWAWSGLELGFPSVELLAATWGLGLFGAAFIAEELRAGVRAVPCGQLEAATSQGFGHWESLRFVILPQAIRHAWQPLVGQYLNVMKLSSLAMAIGLAELSYQVRQIESYNLHALEAFAVGTALYLVLGLVLGRLLQAIPGALLGPDLQRKS